MNEINNAYAAGIFDGEGCVDIYQATSSKASKSPSLMLRVVISQKDGKIMDWLYEHFGGYVNLNRRKENYIYRWDIRSQKAVRFLQAIQPYLRIKKDQVELALKFEADKGKYLTTLKGKQGFRTLTPDEIKNRLAMKEQLKSLKKQYVLYTKNGAPTTTKRKDPKGM